MKLDGRGAWHLFAALVVVGAMFTTTSANAVEADAPAESLEAVLDLAPPIDAAAADVAPGGGLESEAGPADVTIPADASGAVTLQTSTGDAVSVGVPGGVAGSIEDGAMVYNDAAPSTDVVVQPTVEGVRTLIKMDGVEAPTSFPFPVSVPEGGSIALTEDGGAAVVDSNGAPVVGIPAPWARDADGVAVPTHFEVQDDRLIQHVNHRAAGVAYPVVADPWLQWVKGKLKWVFKGMLVNRAVVWWYEARGYQCDWWAAWWNAPVACYQVAG